LVSSQSDGQRAHETSSSSALPLHGAWVEPQIGQGRFSDTTHHSPSPERDRTMQFKGTLLAEVRVHVMCPL